MPVLFYGLILECSISVESFSALFIKSHQNMTKFRSLESEVVSHSVNTEPLKRQLLYKKSTVGTVSGLAVSRFCLILTMQIALSEHVKVRVPPTVQACLFISSLDPIVTSHLHGPASRVNARREKLWSIKLRIMWNCIGGWTIQQCFIYVICGCIISQLAKIELFQKSTSERPAKRENVSVHWHSFTHHS